MGDDLRGPYTKEDVEKVKLCMAVESPRRQIRVLRMRWFNPKRLVENLGQTGEGVDG